MRHNGDMSVPELAPRSILRGLILCWAIAAVIAIATGIFAPEPWRAAWTAVGLGATVVVAFAVQLAQDIPTGFIRRVAASVLGSVLVTGLIGLIVGLVTMLAG